MRLAFGRTLKRRISIYYLYHLYIFFIFVTLVVLLLLHYWPFLAFFIRGGGGVFFFVCFFIRALPSILIEAIVPSYHLVDECDRASPHPTHHHYTSSTTDLHF